MGLTSAPVLALMASVFAILSAWLLWSRAQRRLRYDMWRMPGPKPWPVIGNVGAVVGSSYAHRIFAEWATVYGSIYKFNLAGADLIVVTDPQEFAKLVSREVNLPKAGQMYRLLNVRPGHSNILATTDHEEWKYFRRMTNAAFSPENIRKAYPRILDAANKATEVLHKMCLRGPVNMDDISQRVTAEVINLTGFDEVTGALQYTTQPDGSVQLAQLPFLEHLKTLQNMVTAAFTNPLYMVLLTLCPWHPQARRNKAAVTALNKKDDATAAEILSRGPQPESDTSLWACLSRFRDHKSGGPVHPATVAVNAGIFFAAGYETTAHTIAWALFELAAQPDLQDRVRKELAEEGLVATADQAPSRLLDFQDLTKFKTLDAVIKEALRLHPTAPIGSVRQTDEDMIILGYRVPKGTPVMLSPYPLQVNPHNFVDPHKFLPERWTADEHQDINPKSTEYKNATAKGNRNSISNSWSPFSSGPRNCIGQSLAMAELRTVLTVFLSNFMFDLPEKVSRQKFIEEEEVWWVTLQAKNGVPLKVKPIQRL